MNKRNVLAILLLLATQVFGQGPTPAPPLPFSATYPTNGDTEITATQKIIATQTYVNAFAVTPNDGTDLTHVASALWVGGAGNVVVNMAGAPGTAVTFNAVAAGTLLRVSVTRVRTATSATNIIALY